MAVILPGIIAGAGALYKGISGFSQAEQGKNMMSNLKRPTYSTPQQIYDNLNLAKTAYSDLRLPGEAAAENKLQSNTSQAVQLAQLYGKSPAEIMATISGANANENAGFTDIATKAADYHAANLEKLKQANLVLAQSKNDEFNINQLQPYNQDRQYAQDLIGAGNKNISGAISDVGLFAGTDAGSSSLGGLYDKFFGSGSKSSYTGYSSGKNAIPDPSLFNF